MVASRAVKDLDSANACASRLDVDIAGLEAAIAKISKKDVSDVVAGLEDIVSLVIASADLTKCKSIMTDGEAWIASV